MGLLETAPASTSRAAWPRPALCETGRIFMELNGQNFECAAVAFMIDRRSRAPLAAARAGRFLHGQASCRGAGGRRRAIDLAREALAAREPDPPSAGRRATPPTPGNMAQGWTARFGAPQPVPWRRAQGVEGAVYGGIFADPAGQASGCADPARRLRRLQPFPVRPARPRAGRGRGGARRPRCRKP